MVLTCGVFQEQEEKTRCSEAAAALAKKEHSDTARRNRALLFERVQRDIDSVKVSVVSCKLTKVVKWNERMP